MGEGDLKHQGSAHFEPARGASSAPAGLYLITADSPNTAWLLAATRAALSVAVDAASQPAALGRVMWLQYRNKCAAHSVRREQARELRELTQAMQVRLLINDDIDLAVAVGADGVHLGRDDASMALARERLGQGAVVGASAYGELGRAQQAWRLGAGYVAFGSLFASAVKPQAPRCPLMRLGQARREGLHTVGIGGIDASNIAQVARSGAHAAALISAVYDAACPQQATMQLLTAFIHGASQYDAKA
ncbi:MAG TPA: thiamine phosphate synthase [Burkholderiaceae bacterium]|nr:thiamine phosphate synthase [Burkholderiaceae bacterium]